MIPDSEDGTYIENTINLMRRIEETGVKAIGLHCRSVLILDFSHLVTRYLPLHFRFQTTKESQAGFWDIFKPVAEAIKIPVIANGDIYTLEDVKRLKELSGRRLCVVCVSWSCH